MKEWDGAMASRLFDSSQISQFFTLSTKIIRTKLGSSIWSINSLFKNIQWPYGVVQKVAMVLMDSLMVMSTLSSTQLRCKEQSLPKSEIPGAKSAIQALGLTKTLYGLQSSCSRSATKIKMTESSSCLSANSLDHHTSSGQMWPFGKTSLEKRPLLISLRTRKINASSWRFLQNKWFSLTLKLKTPDFTETAEDRIPGTTGSTCTSTKEEVGPKTRFSERAGLLDPSSTQWLACQTTSSTKESTHSVLQTGTSTARQLAQTPSSTPCRFTRRAAARSKSQQWTPEKRPWPRLDPLQLLKLFDLTPQGLFKS